MVGGFIGMLALTMESTTSKHQSNMKILIKLGAVIMIIASILSSCMKRNITGDYAAKIYHYPNGGHHENIEKVESRQVTDSLGNVHYVHDTVILHVIPERRETTTRFFFHIDKYLNVTASYSEGLHKPPTNYYGKGKLKNKSLIVDFNYRDTKDYGLGGTIYDSIRYSPPLRLRFSVESNLENDQLGYSPSEQLVDSLDEFWSTSYSFKIQE